jgi:two-component system, OmpR family, response regulator MprA
MRHGKRILVVDDNEVIQEVLREFLRRDYTVETVGDAALALTAVIQNKPHAILIDVHLPGVDGLSLLKTLREMGVQTPIFVTTGYGSKQVALEALERGANGYLPKPFDLLHLEQLLADALRSSA